MNRRRYKIDNHAKELPITVKRAVELIGLLVLGTIIVPADPSAAAMGGQYQRAKLDPHQKAFSLNLSRRKRAFTPAYDWPPVNLYDQKARFLNTIWKITKISARTRTTRIRKG